MRAKGKPEVPAGIGPVDIESVWIGEYSWIPVGGAQHTAYGLTGSNLHTLQNDIRGGMSHRGLDRGQPAHHLLE
jgi:hypothetical protein